ncbi:MAG TPA: tetratricopeptide repeat protein [Candidatus Krumholzibacteria bacterium]|nr:tetratricopeptide repeat protein [Candidatus Krumholzibacteria bacterium]
MKPAALWLAVMLLASGVPAVHAAGNAPSATGVQAEFADANKAYEAEDYAGAIDRYTQIVQSGVVHVDLFYNLGNAYFKSGDLGHAVLWYERALRLDPRNDDVRANLGVVRSLLRDQQLLPAHGGIREVLMGWHRRLSASDSAVAASLCYGLFTLAALCLIFRRSAFVTAFYRRASWVSPGRLFGLDMGQDILLGMTTSAALALVFALSAYTKVHDERVNARSVVVSEEVPVYSGPSQDATVQFKIHEGTIVMVRDGRPGWVRVDLPGDLSGWVDVGTVEKI